MHENIARFPWGGAIFSKILPQGHHLINFSTGETPNAMIEKSSH